MPYFEKQLLINWLNSNVDSLTQRGSMYGSLGEQEVTLISYMEVRNFIDNSIVTLAKSRTQICKKYKLSSKVGFSISIKSQELLSQVLKDWWELNDKLVKLKCFW